MDRERHAWRVPVLLLCFSIGLMGWLSFAPRPSRPVVVFFAPSLSKERSFAAALDAGAQVLGGGAWPNSLVVQSPSPDFFARLRAAGAWLIVDAKGAGGCNSKTNL